MNLVNFSKFNRSSHNTKTPCNTVTFKIILAMCTYSCAQKFTYTSAEHSSFPFINLQLTIIIPFIPIIVTTILLHFGKRILQMLQFKLFIPLFACDVTKIWHHKFTYTKVTSCMISFKRSRMPSDGLLLLGLLSFTLTILNGYVICHVILPWPYKKACIF